MGKHIATDREGPNSRRWTPYAAVLLAATFGGTIGTDYRVIDHHVQADKMTVVTICTGTAALLLGGWLVI